MNIIGLLVVSLVFSALLIILSIYAVIDIASGSC